MFPAPARELMGYVALFIILDLIIVGLKWFELMILEIRDTQVILKTRMSHDSYAARLQLYLHYLTDLHYFTHFTTLMS